VCLVFRFATARTSLRITQNKYIMTDPTLLEDRTLIEISFHLT